MEDPEEWMCSDVGGDTDNGIVCSWAIDFETVRAIRPDPATAVCGGVRSSVWEEEVDRWDDADVSTPSSL